MFDVTEITCDIFSFMHGHEVHAAVTHHSGLPEPNASTHKVLVSLATGHV